MGSRILICGIVIFALAFARANVYGQRIETVDYGLLINGIDSVLKSHNLYPDSVFIVVDSFDRKILPVATKHFICDSVILLHVAGYRKIYNNNGSSLEGQAYVSVSGELRYKNTVKKKEFFSFERSSNYGACIFNPAEESKSFWDSTAKPILVTLGAVAVIALFFLVRG
jgi:hypothetical protein